MPESLGALIDHLLTGGLTDAALESELTTLAAARQAEFSGLAGTWALSLYERSPYIFGDFIVQHVPVDQPQVVEELLRRAEADNQESVFRGVYKRVATRERWNTDIVNLIRSAPDYDTIIRGIHLRAGPWAIIGEDVLILLYRRDPAAFKGHFESDITYALRGSFQLPPGRLEYFRREVNQREAGSPFAALLFRRYATPAEWHDAVRRLLRERPAKIADVLVSLHPQDPAADLDVELVDALVKVFGEAVMPYLNRHSQVIVRRKLEILIQSTPDDEQLWAAMQQMIATAPLCIRKLTHVWAPALYKRNADFWGPFIASNWYIDPESPAIPELLAQAKRDGRYDFYRQLYARTVQTVDRCADWNADLLAVVRSDMSTGQVQRELERLDIRREHGYGKPLIIADETAVALYRRGPEMFREFIWRYIPDGIREYPELMRAIQEAGDVEFFRQVFRKTATSFAWNEEMRRLLEQDIPPDRILRELEQRKPAKPSGVNPAILAEFMRKYGEAVLPFFERYIDWTAPSRLNALLDLDIDQGTLLRELTAIAQRQPFAFAARADIWLPRLYERNPEFFATFMARHVTPRDESAAAIKALLPRIEADGHDSLFRSLYNIVYRRDDWQCDIARLVRANLDDDQLHAALMRRASNWNALPDDLAAELYRRSADRFREFIVEHVRQEYGRKHKYDQLRSAAEERGDTALVDTVLESVDPQAHWQRRLKQLLQQDVPPDQVAAELKRLTPSNTYGLDDGGLIARFVEKYGDAVMPFLFDGSLYWHSRQPHVLEIAKAVKRYASKPNYWRFHFQIHADNKEWYKALVEIARLPVSDAEFRLELAYLTPDNPTVQLPDEASALALYGRSPEIARPFLQRFFQEGSVKLFQAAEAQGDEDFLDYLAYRMLIAAHKLAVGPYYVNRARILHPSDKKAQQELAEFTGPVIAFFDRLAALSPATYIRHAGHILSYVRPFEFGWGRWSTPSERSPLWAYLVGRYHEDWRRSAEGMTGLMESPSIHIQLAALDILAGGGEEAAARVVENVFAFRALLLGNAFKRAKRKALSCLEMAARSHPDAAARILPVLKEAMDFRARRAIPDDITVAYVRIQG